MKNGVERNPTQAPHLGIVETGLVILSNLPKLSETVELTLEFSCLCFQSRNLLIVYTISPSWSSGIVMSFNIAMQGTHLETSPVWPIKVKAPDLDTHSHIIKQAISQ